jgi:hypothetical protein
MNFLTKELLIALILLPLLTLSCVGDSSNSDFPEGCVSKDYEYKDNNLILEINPTEQTLYLFHNISDTDYWVNHPVTKDPGVSAGWASILNAGQWSALAIYQNSNSENFAISCETMGKDGALTYHNCQDVLRTCIVEKAEFKTGDKGSYWVAENKSLNDLVKEIKSRGITW